jgi:hypothetical protein
MNYKNLIVVLIIISLILAVIVYVNENEKIEKFQDSEVYDSQVSVSPAVNVVYQRDLDINNDVFYLETSLDQEFIKSGNTRDRFYRFNNPKSAINVSNVNSKNFTFSYYFKKETTVISREVLVSSNYWYIDLINNSLRLVYNGIPVTSVVTIKPYTIYNCTIVIANNGINITVNGNEKIKKMSMPDLITKTVKLGSDKNNQNNFTGKMGGVFLAKTQLKNDEICDITNFCQFESTECAFVPHGGNLMECIESCSDNCQPNECQKICLDCNNPDMCNWVERTSENTVLGQDATIPEPVRIRAVAHNEGEILLDWKKPESTGGNIKSYIIIVYESFNRRDGIRTSVLSNPNCSVCEYVVTGLKNQVFYDIAVRSVNDIGISEMSNIETIAPNGPISSQEISEFLVETDNEIMKDFYKDVDIKQRSCNIVASKNREGHILDRDVPNFVQEIKDHYSEKLEPQTDNK